MYIEIKEIPIYECGNCGTERKDAFAICCDGRNGTWLRFGFECQGCRQGWYQTRVEAESCQNADCIRKRSETTEDLALLGYRLWVVDGRGEKSILAAFAFGRDMDEWLERQRVAYSEGTRFVTERFDAAGEEYTATGWPEVGGFVRYAICEATAGKVADTWETLDAALEAKAALDAASSRTGAKWVLRKVENGKWSDVRELRFRGLCAKCSTKADVFAADDQDFSVMKSAGGGVRVDSGVEIIRHLCQNCLRGDQADAFLSRVIE